jgi:tRNA(adenine34) deaminase
VGLVEACFEVAGPPSRGRAVANDRARARPVLQMERRGRDAPGAMSADERSTTVDERVVAADERFMALALDQARRAAEHGDIPVGAVIAHRGDVLAAAHNERELRSDPTAHAEMVALRAAASALGSWRVLECTLYVTLEPCAMCAGAIVLARVPEVVFAAADPKAGAAGSVLDVLGDTRLNHRPLVRSGPLAAESGRLLREFFAARR